MNQSQPYHNEYETLCRDMTDSGRLEESHFAFREMRDAWRNYELAVARYAIICTVRAEVSPFEEEAEIIPFIPRQTGEL